MTPESLCIVHVRNCALNLDCAFSAVNMDTNKVAKLACISGVHIKAGSIKIRTQDMQLPALCIISWTLTRL